ncbi:MAG: hypothetical protein HYZ34_14260 [Ignavibacteriae bacterium]|nr:hypothetical protein [Ignavibacteriota bacterium]
MAIQKNYEIDTQNWSPIQKELEAAIDQIPFSSGTECIRKGQRDSNGNPYCQ